MLMLAAAAFAAFPEQVSITAMDDFHGASTQPATENPADDYVALGFTEVVKELGCTIANKPLAPADTLGLYGFHIGVAATVSFLQTAYDKDGNPSGWALVDPYETPSPVMFIPWIQVRKGLPLSTEVGLNVGWIGMSDTAVVGGFGRIAPLEGYHYLPDLAFQVGYAAYVGNDELELGTLDLSAEIGYSLAFGAAAGVHDATFDPFVSVGVNEIHAAPRVDLSRTDLGERIHEVTGADAAAEGYDATLAPFQLGGGFRIKNRDFSTTIAATWSPDIVPTVNIAFGYTH